MVDASGGEARVLGTEFEVRLQPAGAQVTVLSGRVGVKAGEHAPQQILTADQQVAYADGAVSDAVQQVDSQARLAWRSGWLSYYKTPLADVVADLRRYYPGKSCCSIASWAHAASAPASQPGPASSACLPARRARV